MYKLNDEHPKSTKDKFSFVKGTAINNHHQKQINSTLLQNHNSNFIIISQGTKLWNNEIPEQVKKAPSSKCFVKR